MKKLLKKTVYLFSFGLFTLVLTGCDAKINPEVLQEYAKTVDSDTLREYAAILENVADGMDAGLIDMVDFSEIDLESFDGEGLITILDEAEAAYGDEAEKVISEAEALIEENEDEINEAIDKADAYLNKQSDANSNEADKADEVAAAKEDKDVADDDAAEEAVDEEDMEEDENTAAEVVEEVATDDVEEEATDDEEDAIIVEITEQYSMADTIDYGKGKELYVEYNVPSIQYKSSGAKKINDEIYDFCKSSIKTAEALLNGTAKDKDAEPEFVTIDYDVYENDGIVSIVVCGTPSDDEAKEYRVFNYDTNTGKKVDNDDMLEHLDLTEDELNEYVCKTLGAEVLSYLDDEIDYIKESYAEDNEKVAAVIGTISAFYQYTISNVDVTDDLELYIDEDGDPAIIGKIYLPTGDGAISFDTKINTDENPEIFDEYVEYANKYHYPELEMNSILLDEGMRYELMIPTENITSDFNYDEVSIGFDEDDSSVFVISFVSGKKEYKYTGSIEIAGFSENGINFHYELTDLNGKKLGNNSLEGNFDVLIGLKLDDNGDIISQNASIAVTDGFDFTGADGEIAVFDLGDM